MTRSVVVVGGGFCGAMVALHLRRDHPSLDASLTVIEKRPVLGAGLAYGTADPACRINVAASRMSPFEETPLAFDEWLRDGGADPSDDAMEGPGGLFPSRTAFGRYVASLMADQQMTHRRATAVAAGRTNGRFTIRLDDGDRLEADMLVLATGHPRPGLPAVLTAFKDDRRLLGDPWDAEALARVAQRPNARVLLLGTGLTACDVLASLRRRGHRGAVVAVSRHGFLPRPRTTLPVAAHGAFAEAPSPTAAALLGRIRRAVADASALGRPWEDVITALREQAPDLWRALPDRGKKRLLRHARAFWDVHRFQCAPQIASLIEHELSSGGLAVHAASVREVRPGPHGLVLTLAGRGSGATMRLETDWLVNCTGPGHAGAFASGLLASLRRQGLAEPDKLGLGVETGFDNLAVGSDGFSVEGLFVAGPPARSAHGELMGLPQVTRQPRAIAGAIASRCADARIRNLIVAGRNAR